MIINVASKNIVKVKAVEETLQEYPAFISAHVKSVEGLSEVSPQPLSREETIRGAIHRAMNSFESCTYSIGLEGGLMETPYTKTGYLDHCVCALYDGKNEPIIGISPGFEYPPAAIELLLKNQGQMDASTAFKKLGLTNKEKIGSEEGIIGYLTKGKFNRKEYIKTALHLALIQLEFPELYKK